MAIGKKVRFEVFKRDGFCCVYCGSSPAESELEVDHIIPKCKGGSDDIANLATSCFKCNRGKSGTQLTSVKSSQLSERNSNIATRLAMAQSERIKAVEEFTRHFSWLISEIERTWKTRLSFAKERSVKTFLRKLDAMDVMDSAEVANQKRKGEDRWKYFCGICWNKIREDGGDE